MQAAWYEGFGPASEVLKTGHFDEPEPAPGEVQVQVATSGVNPVDVKRRGGGRGDMPAARMIPHFDGAGVIAAVGEGVSTEWVGERVWFYEANWGQAQGSAAEFTTVPAERTVPLPENMDFAAGACMGIPALTAHRCVFADGPVSGQTVLVTGGAGSVGSYAVQFAKLAGANVISTVSSDEKAELALSFGAAHTINYRGEDVAARIAALTDGAGVDRIVEVEFGGNLKTSIAALKVNGVIAAYASDAARDPAVPFYELVYKNITVRHVLVFNMPEAAKADAIADIARWSAAGELRHHIGPHFPLDQIALAHQTVESGSMGNVIVDVAAL